ncbi:lytic murein transglycosylase [Jannaschia rubra]|uniref:Membrane-bound lytic murein transglycosylase B n=1 Tax=Jannaschia rubra TaxID=282197 RepID=A0A0M6XKF0_9RHOB|nr:lytic murein transglycosylase [Jannaschia rubra]CTQ31579.1 Membrane-bound lytic murein transglycosylase B precursor [Jannaschia rubra]SFF76918.1 membrane-bound lytic murein transglycosylase B [Jannaschia rubra]
MRRLARYVLPVLLIGAPAHPQAVDPVLPVAQTAPAVPFTDWLSGFRERATAAGIDAATLDAGLRDVRHLPDIIRLDRNQSEFTKTLWDYLDTATSEQIVARGRDALDRHATTFGAVEERFGVPREIVAAVWGLESSFGAFRGDVPTLSALATLAADSRRGDFFEAQLLAALRILQDGETSADALRGSWAGAMGHTQFMPSSYAEHAVDFTGDGRRDIWGDDPTDALASTAAYLKAYGWITGQPWGLEVVLPEGFDYRLTGERVEKTPAEWTALGVRTVTGDPIPDGGPASVRTPAGHEGAAFATFANFRVIETYNTADAYVIGVGHLSDRLAGGPTIASGWPRGDRALTLAERIEMQELLRDAGFDPLKIDGKVGPDTLDAIQRWQASEGLVPDGYVDPDLLDRLRD